MNKLNYKEQCPQSLLCSIKLCENKHYRCFVGICIEGMIKDDKNGKCSNQECKLYHYTAKEFKKEFNTSPINGIYRFNICRNPYCEIQKNCSFLHPKWAMKYCIDYLMDNCEDEHSNHAHVEWNDIRNEVYTIYKDLLKMECNPEHNLEQEKVYFQNNNICFEYLKGLCEKKNGECLSCHIFWEDLNKIEYLKKQQLKSCIQENTKENHITLQQIESSLLHCTEEDLKKLQQAALKQNIIDVIFIMDFTGTMQVWIDACKSQIKGTIEAFKKVIPGCTLRIGIVGYRDVTDDIKITCHDLTSKIEQLEVYLATQTAYGGGDEAEDVCSGIRKAMCLNISNQPDSILITILFADAPCHGIQYHDGISDDLAEEVSEGTLEKLMQQYDKIKQNNFFFCVQITKSTNLMFNIMKQNFRNLFITQTSKHSELGNLLELSLKKSLSQIRTTKIQYQAKFQKPKYKEYISETNKEKKQFWSQILELFEYRNGETVLEIDDQELNIKQEEKGVNFKVYKGFDITNNQKIIIKIKKDDVQENKKLTDTFMFQQQSQVQRKVQLQALVRQMAKIFRDKIGEKKIEGAPPIFVPAPIQYDLLGKQFKGQSQLYGEIFLEISCDWEKYSNDGCYRNPDYYYFSSFSHFVFEESQRLFTFVDIQGKRNLLTDLVVLIDKNFQNTIQTNCQEVKVGFDNFLAQHDKCSYICSQLNLPNINSSTHLNQTKWKNVNQDGKIDALCDSCDTQIKLVQDEYYVKKMYEKCERCIERSNESQQQFCCCCKDVFSIQINYKQKIQTVVDKCDDCKSKCKKKSGIKCLYCNLNCVWNISHQIIKETLEQIVICSKGKKYIQSIKCCICQSYYNFTTKLTIEDYEKQYYRCLNCKQK